MSTKLHIQRTPGPQNPSRYPFVGKRYQTWGEQKGYIYDPYSDQYQPDPNVQNSILQGQGVIPTPPSLTSQLIPAMESSLAGSAAKAVGDKIPDVLSGIGKGLFGGGDAAASTPGIMLSNGSVIPAGSAIPAGLTDVGSAAIPAAKGLFGFGSGTGLGTGEAGTLGIGQGGFGGPALGLMGIYDVLHNKRKGAGGLAEGAASGAAAGSYFGPWEIGIGAVLGAGASLLNRGYSNLEDQKRAELAAKGLQTTSGNGAWEKNPDFAQSRDESKLKGEDIIGASDWSLGLDPQRWNATPRARQIEIANEAIKRGLVREHNGGMDINTGGLSDFFKA